MGSVENGGFFAGRTEIAAADTTNGAFKILVEGAAAKTVKWVA